MNSGWLMMSAFISLLCGGVVIGSLTGQSEDDCDLKTENRNAIIGVTVTIVVFAILRWGVPYLFWPQTVLT